MDGGAGLHVVVRQRLVVRHLLARIDEADLVRLDALFFLELALHHGHRVGVVEVELRLAACQRFDCERGGGRQGAGGQAMRQGRTLDSVLTLR